jgi:hypothetical protein
VKAIRYFAIFIAISLWLVIFSYSRFGGIREAETRYNQGASAQQEGRQQEMIAGFDGPSALILSMLARTTTGALLTKI